MPVNRIRSPRSSAAHQHILRERNLALVADAVVRSSEPVSRADVATSTGLARATVSTLVDRLVAGRFLTELPPMALGGAGRPAVPLVPTSRSFVGIGIEVSSAFLGVGAVDLTGEIIDVRIEPGDFRDTDPAQVLAQAGALARGLIADLEAAGMIVAGARLALPGLVDSESGELRFAPNLGWESVDPIPALGLSGLPIVVANDTKLAAISALGETTADGFIYLYSEGGIGGALVIDRQIARGDAEFGHVLVDLNGPECRCGSRGCVEQYAGKAALMIGAGLAPGDPVSDLVNAVKAGDTAAVSALKSAAFALGQALSDALNIINVTTILFGGALGQLLPLMQTDIEEIMTRRVLTARYVPVSLQAAVGADYPSIIGGALDVLRELINDPSRWV